MTQDQFDALEARVSALEAKLKGKQTVKPAVDWLAEIKANPLYAHVNFERVFGDIERWKLKPMNANRQITRKFLINWLNKIDVPVALPNGKQKPPPPPPKNDPIARGAWGQIYGSPKEHGYE